MSTVLLERARPRTSVVRVDQITKDAIAPYDYSWDGEVSFYPFVPPPLPADFTLGVVVGSSGSGKSTLLAALGGASPAPAWGADNSIASHFASAEDAADRLTSVGLGSVPLWCKPYSVLSNGEKFRADLGRHLESFQVVDEFTSVVDRHVALAASRGFGRHLRREGKRNVVVATCHRDVLPWLDPDWVIDTDAGLFISEPKEWVQPATLVVDVHRARKAAWQHFVEHHYLASSLHPFARCYLATWGESLVGFAAAIPFPHGSIKGGWRETRTVVLPEFQGLGIGVRLSDIVAALHRAEGYRYFSRTQHPRMGEYRERSEKWEATSSNRKKAKPPASGGSNLGHMRYDGVRLAYSHEYVGPASAVRDPAMPTPEQRAKPYNYRKKD